MNKAILIVIVLTVISCKTVQISQLTTKTIVELGTIGSIKQTFLTNRLTTVVIPIFKQKIRVSVSIIPFNKRTYKLYAEAARHQNKVVNDSVINKLVYVNVEIIDKVQLIKELNADYNTATSIYLQQSKENELVIQVSAFFDAIDLSNLSQAEEVYLLNNKPQKYVLELVKGGKAFAHIDLSKGATFGFSTASFCWKKEQGKISLANLVSSGEHCTNDTYKNVRRLDKKINYFKM